MPDTEQVKMAARKVIFISYASEDARFADALNRALVTTHDVEVLIDSQGIRAGDSLTAAFNDMLLRSGCVVMIVSDQYLSKYYPRLERGGAIARESVGATRIIPVLHGVSIEQLKQQLPTLADLKCLDAAEGADGVASRIREAIGLRVADSEAPPRATPQVAAICFSKTQTGSVSFLLVRTKKKGEGQRWHFPKGNVKKTDLGNLAEAAKREAEKEGGIQAAHTEIVGTGPVADYQHFKRSGRMVIVTVFLLRVGGNMGPIEGQRKAQWCSYNEAVAKLQGNRRERESAPLLDVLKRANDRINLLRN